jgi:crossover junction endodeoxyribonuclease RusA
MILNLRWPPTSNTYWRRNGNRYFISKRGLDYRFHVLEVANGLQIRFKPLFSGPVAVTIDAYPADKRIRDIDNLPKSVLDSLQYCGIFKDDNQVARLTIERKEIVKGGRLTVTIESLSPLPGKAFDV